MKLCVVNMRCQCDTQFCRIPYLYFIMTELVLHRNSLKTLLYIPLTIVIPSSSPFWSQLRAFLSVRCAHVRMATCIFGGQRNEQNIPDRKNAATLYISVYVLYCTQVECETRRDWLLHPLTLTAHPLVFGQREEPLQYQILQQYPK